jgi:hypothetical protein
MKTLIILLLLSLSPLAAADGYYGNPYQGGYNPYQGGYNPYQGGYSPYYQGGYGGYNQSQIQQNSIDAARLRQFQLQQDVERYNQMRQSYQDRRETERFASFGNDNVSNKPACAPKAVMTNEEMSRCK